MTPTTSTPTTTTTSTTFDDVAATFASITSQILEQVRRRIVGQDEVVRELITSLVCGGHVLLEGVPGLGKTEMLKSLAESVQATFSRIQFTPDLMPADVVGTDVISAADSGGRTFEYRRGPVFANLVLADEINRATPKTQSSLLEAMQERQVTVGGETRELPDPFMVMATQNPIELEGTYPLPEAQLDRFFVKVLVPQPGPELMAQILSRTTGNDAPEIEPVCSPEQLRWLAAITRQVPIAAHLVDYTALLVTATNPGAEHAPALVRHYVRSGASPRGGQSMILAAKARALFAGRPYVSGADLTGSARAALRHRVLLGYEASADGITSDDVIDDVIASTVEPGQDRRGLGGPA